VLYRSGRRQPRRSRGPYRSLCRATLRTTIRNPGRPQAADPAPSGPLQPFSYPLFPTSKTARQSPHQRAPEPAPSPETGTSSPILRRRNGRGDRRCYFGNNSRQIAVSADRGRLARSAPQGPKCAAAAIHSAVPADAKMRARRPVQESTSYHCALAPPAGDGGHARRARVVEIPEKHLGPQRARRFPFVRGVRTRLRAHARERTRRLFTTPAQESPSSPHA